MRLPPHYFSYLEPDEIRLIHEHWAPFAKQVEGRPDRLNTREDENLTGLFGECAVGKWFKIPVDVTLSRRPELKAGHWIGDVGNDIELLGYKFDVKTQLSNYSPTYKYRWNIPYDMAHNPNKECDGYIWTFKKLGDDTRIEIIGWMWRQDFIDQARDNEDGAEMDGHHGFYKCRTYDITEEHMNDLMEFKRSMI